MSTNPLPSAPPAPVAAGHRYLANVELPQNCHVPMTAIIWDIDAARLSPREAAGHTDHWLLLLSLVPQQATTGEWIPVRGWLDDNRVITPDAQRDDRLDRLPARSPLTYTRITLEQQSAPYEPHGAEQSVEAMRERVAADLAALAGLSNIDPLAHTASLRPLLDGARAAREQAREFDAARNAEIRRLLAAGVRPADVMAETGLSRGRIDQIKHHRR